MNQYGVFENTIDIVLAREKGLLVKIYLAEHNGCWLYGVHYDCGGISEGAAGFGFRPSIRRKKYGDKITCIKAAKEYLRVEIEKHLNFTNHNRYVKKLIEKALDVLKIEKQLELKL